MFTVDFHPLDKDYLLVKFKYYKPYIERIRNIPGAKWSPLQRSWVIPIGALEYLEEEMKGELVYVPPKWAITGEPMPDVRSMFKVPEIPVPKLLLPLKDYQVFGVRYLIDRLQKRKFAILADDVGLGKSPTALAVMLHWSKMFGAKKFLIVCKKSLRTQWKRDVFGKFFPAVLPRVLIVTGDKRKREKVYKEFEALPSGVIITNYHTIMNDADRIAKLGFQMVIIDEAHKVSTRTGVINEAHCKVCAHTDKVLYLTGTPIMSSPQDIFGIAQIADPSFFGDWKSFEKEFIVYDRSSRYESIVGYKNLDKLRTMVQEVVLRRTEFEVEVELPETVRNKLETYVDEVQYAIYDQLKTASEDIEAKLAQEKAKSPRDPAQIEILEGMAKGIGMSRQAAANDPRLFLMSKSQKMVKDYGGMIPQSYKRSPKTELLLDQLQTITDSGHKAIVFTKFERGVRLLADDIEKELKIHAVTYSGKVDDDLRDRNVSDFWNDPDTRVFVCNDAAAEGLNLQIAKYVINYDQPDTPGLKTQRLGRVRRLNSAHQIVYEYDLITMGTKDEEMLNQLELKSNLFSGVVGVDEAQSQALKSVMKGDGSS